MQQTMERPRTEAQRRTVQAQEQREAQRRSAEARRRRSSAEGLTTTSPMYVAIARIITGAPGSKDRIVIEPGVVFDPTVRETAVTEEEVQLLLDKGGIVPVPVEPPPPVEGGGTDTVTGAADTIAARDESA
jgi:hypothetical protein